MTGCCVADLVHHFAQMILRDDADDFAGGFGGFVAQELGRLHRFGQAIDGAVREHVGHFAAAAFQAVFFHGGFEAGPIELQIMLGANLLEQLRRKAVRRVQVGRFLAGNQRAAFLFHRFEQPIDPVQAAVDRAQESFLLRC